MANQNYSIDQRLLNAQVAIDNSINAPEILAVVTLYGYDLARLQAALALYHEVMDLVAAQKREYGDQYEATAVMRAAWETADLAYKLTLKLARLVFKNDADARGALLLSGSRKLTIGGWIEQVTVFYKNLLEDPALIAAMTAYNYDEAKLQAEADLVQVVVDANAVQEREKGQAVAATELRDAKIDELDEWLADYKVVAQVAFDDAPQMLKQLGFGAG